ALITKSLQISANKKFVELFFVDFRWCVDHHIPARIVFREGDEVANCLLSAENCNQSVESESQSTMRRRSILEGVHQKSELIAGFFLRKSEMPEHELLRRSIVNPN